MGYCVPIIILEIWEVHFWLWDLQNMWKDSLRHAENLMMQYPSQQSTINAAQHRLTSCRWNEEIQGFSGAGRSVVGVLMHYLSISCLVTTDVIHHIEILQAHLERMDLKIRLIPLFNIQHLSRCSSQGSGGLATYKHLQTYSGLCHLGMEFISGAITHLGGIIHVTSNHWISFVISSEDSRVFLGDSMSRAMVEAMGNIKWWLNTYSGSNT